MIYLFFVKKESTCLIIKKIKKKTFIREKCFFLSLEKNMKK